MGNAFLNKQKAVNRAVFDAAQQMMMQFDVDIMVSLLHSEGRGEKRITKFIEQFMELHDFYIVAFDPKHPEADYRRELLDREQRAVFGEKAVSFEERHPIANEIRYDKPAKQHKKRR